MYVVVQKNDLRHKLYACHTDEGVDAWTALKHEAEQFTARNARREIERRELQGHYMRGHRLDMEPV